MISAAVIEALKEIVPADKVLLQEPMKLHTTFRIGGPADCLVYLENEEQLCKIQKYLRLVDVPYTVIGNGSNLLVSDQGYAGIVLVVGKHMSRIEVKDCYLEAEAGVSYLLYYLSPDNICRNLLQEAEAGHSYRNCHGIFPHRPL